MVKTLPASRRRGKRAASTLSKRRRETRLPVVRVDDVPRRLADVVLGELQRRDREHAEPLGVVVEVPSTRAVVAVAVEEPRHVHHHEPPARLKANVRET